jgi:hypothetical protein
MLIQMPLPYNIMQKQIQQLFIYFYRENLSFKFFSHKLTFSIYSSYDSCQTYLLTINLLPYNSKFFYVNIISKKQCLFNHIINFYDFEIFEEIVKNFILKVNNYFFCDLEPNFDNLIFIQ